MKQCPVCKSWETTRKVQSFSVWFECRRCGHHFD